MTWRASNENETSVSIIHLALSLELARVACMPASSRGDAGQRSAYKSDKSDKTDKGDAEDDVDEQLLQQLLGLFCALRKDLDRAMRQRESVVPPSFMAIETTYRMICVYKSTLPHQATELPR